MTISEPKVTKELIERHGITPEEYDYICKILGREPNFTELGIFSVMWSEHCSYKNSKPVLKKLTKTTIAACPNSLLLVKPGDENAGVIDIGDGLAICFKIESHNHPSAIEPFQGAATGVGGIIRDIFTMGARPILCMDSLRFGKLDEKINKHLLRGVVAGIAHYGNCIGLPTVGGEIYFDESYEGNCLVNALCLGLMKKEDMIKGSAKGAGNPVYYVGATTGRDGLGGAAFASRELTEESKEDRPAVQVGDPFLEKLLLEACLELKKTGAIVGMQDMGAAGLTCSTCETASRGSTGIEIDLVKVPKRETGMVPYEIMLSESQERMLVIVEKGKEKIVEAIFEKWDLHAVKIGEVRDGHLMKVYENGRLVAEIPARALAEDGLIYNRESTVPGYLKEMQQLDLNSIAEPADFNQVLLKLLDDPSIASKAWIYEQYDHMVRTDTVFLPGHDAALVRVKGTKKGIALATDCNGLYCYLDPYEGGKIAVAESARNVVCSGAKPIAITNCLNFGNPMKPDIFWQFQKCVEGMTDACCVFQTPVTGGNVSFYNESPKGAIYPTPTIGMLGLMENIESRIPSFFQKAGDTIYLLGETLNEIGASQYLLNVHGLKQGLPPRLDLKKEKALHEMILSGAQEKTFVSCHDLSDGGLAVAVAECLFGKIGHPLGARIDFEFGENLRRDALLFGETQSRVLVSVETKNEKFLEALATEHGVPFYKLGKVTENRLKIDSFIDIDSTQLEQVYRQAIPRRMS
ncbi:MAG: phosphoribosylformylglycinamidine synthase II [Omnitrophica bacterium RIFCSPLOWO2_12_FULL_44_17]|uniref:Phosphoribosylformylglycinamidine synthase subunit PurL n=1 Tax=Candidatus Danuiimicrobium aquiferis TaxID=1801832 RepID=A0A1G1KWC1_9BACT|nr:MAG: phosphoribosylformylglycinamidine synthase II [Omnitrophica bacterium RIFCSPHIGHO2_02_FULL_45_28]OGW90314.1 MAG: phosphoribosylformylglycinamidine synthase II [Omnitrophica bacterium RIFCSPHIGHO2_12_FULL_44_12]OGW97246.1 MAG: phosphoribosylformylglycinamidine synthase II [Omnitrophica bacterium RIFCSPLOWO2_12_FULL_44_17]